jgi:glycosyltransferase involved in cell wall biosynthesis
MKMLNRYFLITPSISKEASGPTYSVKRLTESIFENNVNIELLALDWPDSPNFPYLKKFNIDGNLRLGRSKKLYSYLLDQIHYNKNILFHNHGMWQLNAVYPGFLAIKYRIPYIVSPRGTFSNIAFKSGSILKFPFWKFIQKPSFKSVSIFHATSYSEYLDIRRMGFKQPVAIIPNGIDIPQIEKKFNHKNKRTLLYLGRIHKIKGLENLIEAWGQIQELFPDWQLKIIGDDKGYHGSTGYKSKLLSLTKAKNIKNIHFSDAIYGIEKWREYSDSEIYILPSFSENFGITIAEAMSCGTPVIASDNTPWESVNNKGAGICVSSNVTSLKNALISLMSMDSFELQKMGAKGKIWMKDEFSWEKISKDMLELYDWTINKDLPVPKSIIFD